MDFKLWGATLMGMPDVPTIPSYFIISNRFFFSSLAVQVLFFFLFFYLMVFTLYRAIKNIGNPNIYADQDDTLHKEEEREDRKPEEDIEAQLVKEEQMAQVRRAENYFPSLGISNYGNTRSNAGYVLQDDDQPPGSSKKKHNHDKDSEKENKSNNSDSEDSDSDKEQQDSQLNENQETQQELALKTRLFRYEDSLYKLAPFCVLQVFSVNNFTCDFVSVACLVLMVVLYVTFRTFEVASKHAMLKNLYLLPVLGSFVPYFINQQNFSI